MTAQEAIKILEVAKAECEWNAPLEYQEAFDLAIKALEKQDVPDTISRKAAIDAIVNTVSEIGLHDNSEVARYGATFRQHEIIDIIEGMPSAQSETAKRIVGKSRDGMTMWYQCDMCNEPVDEKDTFCNGCGRRLVNG